MLKLVIMIFFISSVQSNEAKASDQNLSEEAILAISKILEENGVDQKRLVLLSNPKEKESEEEIINARFSGICCKRWIYGKGYVVNCVPYRGLVLNELFRKSCSDMGGEERMYVGADEEQMRAKYGVDIKFD
jgi:hypothetical protein